MKNLKIIALVLMFSAYAGSAYAIDFNKPLRSIAGGVANRVNGAQAYVHNSLKASVSEIGNKGIASWTASKAGGIIAAHPVVASVNQINAMGGGIAGAQKWVGWKAQGIQAAHPVAYGMALNTYTSGRNILSQVRPLASSVVTRSMMMANPVTMPLAAASTAVSAIKFARPYAAGVIKSINTNPTIQQGIRMGSAGLQSIQNVRMLTVPVIGPHLFAINSGITMAMNRKIDLGSTIGSLFSSGGKNHTYASAGRGLKDVVASLPFKAVDMRLTTWMSIGKVTGL